MKQSDVLTDVSKMKRAVLEKDMFRIQLRYTLTLLGLSIPLCIFAWLIVSAVISAEQEVSPTMNYFLGFIAFPVSLFWPLFMFLEGSIFTSLLLPAYLHQGLTRGDVIHAMFKSGARIAGIIACIATGYSAVLEIAGMQGYIDAANGMGFQGTISPWMPTLAVVSSTLAMLLSTFFHLFIAFLAGWFIGFAGHAFAPKIAACVAAFSAIIFLMQVPTLLTGILPALNQKEHIVGIDAVVKPNIDDFMYRLSDPVRDVVDLLFRHTLGAQNPDLWNHFAAPPPYQYDWQYAMTAGALLLTLFLAIGLPFLLKLAIRRFEIKVQ